MSYKYYLGIHESHRYSSDAKSFKALRAELIQKWGWEGGRWYKQTVEGWPKGAMRFVIKRRVKGYYNWRTGKHGIRKERSYILIIPNKEKDTVKK